MAAIRQNLLQGVLPTDNVAMITTTAPPGQPTQVVTNQSDFPYSSRPL